MPICGVCVRGERFFGVWEGDGALMSHIRYFNGVSICYDITGDGLVGGLEDPVVRSVSF